MTVVHENAELVPICPHCSAALNEVHGRNLPAVGSSTFRFGKRYIYACPSCRKVIAISHRKGFWAG